MIRRRFSRTNKIIFEKNDCRFFQSWGLKGYEKSFKGSNCVKKFGTC